MDGIRALAFDVGGTVFDWQTAIRAEIRARANRLGVHADEKAFALDWRAHMFAKVAEVRDGKVPWKSIDTINRESLDEMRGKYAQLAFNDADLDDLNSIWHRLGVFAEFPAALARLRKRYACVVLTLLNNSIVVDSSRNSGICWDLILSCELLGAYKPRPETYQAVPRYLDLTGDQVMMVASHPADLAGARAAGLRTAHVAPRLNEPDFPGFAKADPSEFDIAAADFTDLADKLGC